MKSLLIVNASLLLAVSLNALGQPVPHGLRSITLLQDRKVELRLEGSVAGMFNLTGSISNQFQQMFDLYALESSSNLVDWTRLDWLIRTNSDPAPLLFQDTNSISDRRFYRTFTNLWPTAFPKPSGPFTVGTVDRVMVDPARTNLYRYSPPTNAMTVTFWYPSDPPPAGSRPAPMWGKRSASDITLDGAFPAFGYMEANIKWASIRPKLVGHKFTGLPVASGVVKFPVVIYSHGLSGSRFSSSHIAEELASHGYVVMATDHTDCWAAEFPDGRYLKGATSEDSTNRLQDMTFLIDQLSLVQGADPLLRGRLDLERVGVSGISAGGMVIDTCQTDSRVKCAAVWDGTTSQETNNFVLQKPFLAAIPGVSPYFYWEDLTLFNKAKASAVFLQVKSANHITATDLGWTWQIPWGCGAARAFDVCLVWFFDTYLKGETPAFPTNREFYNVQRK